MVYFAPAKINIGLYITSKRNDGYHNLETVFYPVPLFDVVEIVQSDTFHLFEYGFPSNCLPEKNICTQAFSLLKKYFQIPEVNIHLHKNIPVQAGLGGGSSDAVAVLKLLNEMFSLQISDANMKDLCLQLGSDCPFFVQARPSLGLSRGEQLSTLSLDLTNFTLVIVKPSDGTSTVSAFEGISPRPHGKLKDHILQQIENWKSTIHNDFERSDANSVTEQIKDTLYNSGAIYASLTGSGSAVYGLFKDDVVVQDKFDKDAFIWKKKL